MANSNNFGEGYSCSYPQNGNCIQPPTNTIDSLQIPQNSQNSQNSALPYPSYPLNAQQLSQQNNLAFGVSGIPIIPQNQNNCYGSFCATHDNYAITPNQQFSCPQHNHRNPVSSPHITFTHEVPGYTVMLVYIPTNNLNQQSQNHNNYLNNQR
jgi:hypothetical protein